MTGGMLSTILLLFNAVVAILLVLVILLQKPDTSGGGIMGGANAGSGPVMRNPLVKPTAILAALFMGSSLLLAVLSTGAGRDESVFDTPETATPQEDRPDATLDGGLLPAPSEAADMPSPTTGPDVPPLPETP